MNSLIIIDNGSLRNTIYDKYLNILLEVFHFVLHQGKCAHVFWNFFHLSFLDCKLINKWTHFN